MRPLLDATLAWLAKEFPDRFESSHFVGHENHCQLLQGTKAAVSRELGLDLMIEASADHAQDCLAAGVSVILLRRPWNAHLLPSPALPVATS